MRGLPFPIVLLFLWLPDAASPQIRGTAPLSTGKQIFEAACIACHAHDGRGMPQSTLGFEPPATFPDFTDCRATAREPDEFWSAIIHNGGPARGFSPIMPSFREALTTDQINKVIQYVRGLCKDPAWPPGELNLPLPLITEKAFPEDEWLLKSSLNASGNPGYTGTFIYEKRLGPRNQIEVKAPFVFERPSPGRWNGGAGDMSLGFKRVVGVSRRTGSIFSVVGETRFPTGDKARGLGGGALVFEGFGAWGQLLPRNSFLQFQAGAEAPTRVEDATKAVFWRAVGGTTLSRGRGRRFSPMTELLADRELATGAVTNWDVVPQMQVTINQRQHLRFNAGVRIPVNNTVGRSTAIVFYLLWDTFDGGILDGWK